MPQQLIYTSAPRGIVAGRSGHCTVARSASMREPVMLQLEKFSYYQHLSLSGGLERPIFACRIMDIRGTRFHVLSRIQDSGLDFTGRTNFIAHHLVFEPKELGGVPTPPVILRDWHGWANNWTKEPQLLENEDWAELIDLAGKMNLPAKTWERITGEAKNGYGLLEARAGASFRVENNESDEIILTLFAESLELLEVKDTRQDFRSASWNYTFTTSMQEQDNPADFRWRCIRSDNPTANRFATPNCQVFSAIVVHANQCNEEQRRFATDGWMPTQDLKVKVSDQSIQEGNKVSFEARADGVPYPKYQWYKIDVVSRQPSLLNQATESKLELIPDNLGKITYRVQAFNRVNEKLGIPHPSCDIIIEVRAKPKFASGRASDIVKKVDPREKQIQSLQATFYAYQRRLEDFSDGFFLHLFGIPWRNSALVQLEDIKNGLNEDFAKLKEMLEQIPSDIQGLVENCRGVIYEKSKKARGRHVFAVVTQMLLVLVIIAGLILFIPRINVFQRINSHPATNTNSIESASAPPQNTNTNPLPHSTQTGQAQIPGNTAAQSLPPAKENNLRNDDFGDLPPEWNKSSIGMDNKKASVDFVDSKFRLKGFGERIYGQSDKFFFVFKSVSNSVEFVAQLSSNPGEIGSRRGVMMRESKNSDAPFAFIGLSQTTIDWVQRQTAGTNCTTTSLPVTQLPIFFKITRRANIFSGAYSTNDSNWTGIGTNEISMTGQNYLVGFAVCSGKNNSAVHADFDNVLTTTIK